MMTGQEMFQRTELLIGPEAMQRMSSKRVLIIGVGGVGSWCAESLVRSGIRRLTIVDSDEVCVSNINRQLMATTQTVGQAKVEVLRQRLLAINPQADITALRQRFTEETVEAFDVGSYDYVIDAIDSVKDKALLIETVCQTQAKLFSSMGAALKMDPSRIRVTEFWKVTGDPLARTLRKRFKAQGRYPQRKFLCVYSDERLPNQGLSCLEEGVRVNGTVAHITAIFGFTLASLVLQDIVRDSIS